MQHRQRWFNTGHLIKGSLHQSSFALVSFSMVIFLIIIGEAIMSYFVPVYIQSQVNNTFWMGIILSTSYLVGFLTDIFIGEWFRGRMFFHFLFWACILAIAFPLSFLILPPYIAAFLISMTLWGIYLELISFSQYHFINHFFSHSQHATSWSVLGGFSDAAYLVGPLIAGLVITQTTTLTFLCALGFYLIGFLGLLLFSQVFKKKLSYHYPAREPRIGIVHEFAVWKLLIPKIWPVLLFIFMLVTLDATMWSIGAILSEQFKKLHPFGGLLFVAYLLPSVFMIMFSPRFVESLGKKRAAFILGLVAGVITCFAGVSRSPFSFIALIFLSSIIFASLWPEIRAVIEDYVERLGNAANLMISLQTATVSLGYVLGTIMAGYIASLIGEQLTFSVIGLGIIIASLIGLFVMPRKVRLPQQELKKI
jgi:MFS family permease